MTPREQSAPGLLSRVLLRMEPEAAHEMALGALRLGCWSTPGRILIRRRFSGGDPARLGQPLFGRDLANPIGLAAGFDKNARAIEGLSALGFGFVEIGTVTPRPQAGNPRPRLFRHPEQQSLRNALGFNNDGMESVGRRLEAGYPFSCPLGVNLGMNRDTPLERAESDYEVLFRQFSLHADYFVINISSPNTPGLRDLQRPDRIAGLLELGASLTDRPVLVKLSPDLETSAAAELGRTAVTAGAAGVIVTNTTTDYRLIPGVEERGGLSGRVLRARSFEMLRALARELYGETVLISVGGVDSGDEAYRRLRAGASLVQLYTALIYRGPGLIRSMVDRLQELMDRDGFRSLAEVVGRDVERS